MKSPSTGFSLIELLLALVGALAVGMLLFDLFHQNERVIRDQTSVMEMQQTARVVASQIADEVRMAGQEVPIYSSKWDATLAESVAAILGTSTNNRIDFRGGLSTTETAVTGTAPLDLSLNTTQTLAVDDGSVFSTTLRTTTPYGRFVYVCGPTSNSTWAWVRAELNSITSTALTITPQQSSGMNSSIHFTGLPAVALEEAISIYLDGYSVRHATAIDTTDPAYPLWSTANEIGQNVTALNFIYYDGNNNVLAPDTLANRISIARVDIQLTVQTATALSNGTQPAYSLAVRTIPRNLALRSLN